MTVHLPSALRSYSAQQSAIEINASTLADALTELDRRFPGIRFRIVTEQDTVRPHIRLFVNERQAFDLQTALRHDDELHIVCALSGG
ncbi:MAG: Molybdopterin synthase sulfur carrier subunit [Nitrospira sp.]|nr:MAG: Molybdopterin synthase sulfur carrier subunit [Nitrospira sp.]